MTDTPLDHLESQITELSGHINAATCRWLGLIGEFDDRNGWAAWGCKSCAFYLSWRCGLSPAAAREHVRVARRLRELPVVRESFARGELSYSQVRAITRVATPATEAHLEMIARFATAEQLEVVVRGFRGVLERELGDGEPEYLRRYVDCRHDDDGALLISARLPAEEGALVLRALEAGRDAIREAARDGSASAETTQNGDSGVESEVQVASNADALVLMADTMLDSGAAERPAGDAYQVVVHVDTAELAAEDEEAPGGTCQIEDGTALHPATARRLACDASLVRVIERDGRPLSVGRKTRSVPPALRRALSTRDRCCRFPGCSQRRFLHSHHIVHWARGGRTDMSNLVRLCPHHHRLVHEGGYRIEAQAKGRLRFRRPDGREVPARPAGCRGDTGRMVRGNREGGTAIDSETCVSGWIGDPLDAPYVVGGLCDLDTRLRE